MPDDGAGPSQAAAEGKEEGPVADKFAKPLLPRDHPDVGDLVAGHGAQLGRFQRDDGHRLAIQRDELNLISGPTLMDKNNCTDVARAQRVLGQILRQNNRIMLFHVKFPARRDRPLKRRATA